MHTEYENAFPLPPIDVFAYPPLSKPIFTNNECVKLAYHSRDITTYS